MSIYLTTVTLHSLNLRTGESKEFCSLWVCWTYALKAQPKKTKKKHNHSRTYNEIAVQVLVQQNPRVITRQLLRDSILRLLHRRNHISPYIGIFMEQNFVTEFIKYKKNLFSEESTFHHGTCCILHSYFFMWDHLKDKSLFYHWKPEKVHVWKTLFGCYYDFHYNVFLTRYFKITYEIL